MSTSRETVSAFAGYCLYSSARREEEKGGQEKGESSAKSALAETHGTRGLRERGCESISPLRAKVARFESNSELYTRERERAQVLENAIPPEAHRNTRLSDDEFSPQVFVHVARRPDFSCSVHLRQGFLD